MAVSTLFVTTASRQTPNGTIVGVTSVPPLPVLKSYTQNRTVSQERHHHTISLREQSRNPHMLHPSPLLPRLLLPPADSESSQGSGEPTERATLYGCGAARLSPGGSRTT